MPALDLREIIAAPVDVVYGVVSDVERYPEFLPDVDRVEKRADVVAMQIRAGLVPVRLVTRARFDPPRAIHLDLLEGPFRAFRARWTFTPTEAGATEVAYHADYELPRFAALLGGVGGFLLEQQTQRQIRAFQARVQARGVERSG